MSTWPEASPVGGYTWPKISLIQSNITLGQKMSLPGGMSDQRSAWPKVWPNVNLTQSLILGGYIWPKVSLTQSLTKFQPDLKPHPEGYVWPNVNLTWSCITLGHKMSLPGGTSDPRSAWPEVWQNVDLTQSLILGVHLTKCRKVSWKFEHTMSFKILLHRDFLYERPMKSLMDNTSFNYIRLRRCIWGYL